MECMIIAQILSNLEDYEYHNSLGYIVTSPCECARMCACVCITIDSTPAILNTNCLIIYINVYIHIKASVLRILSTF